MIKNLGNFEVEKVANVLLIDDNLLVDFSVLKILRTVFIKGKKMNKKPLIIMKKRQKTEII